jgi:hypothetical protein
MKKSPFGLWLGTAGTLLTVVFALAWSFPMYWMVVTSLKVDTDTIIVPPTLIPKPFDLTAYTYIIQNSPILNWYVNSIVTSLLITFLVLVLALLCAFAMSQLEFPGKPWLYWIILAGFMIPFQASIVPLFMLMNSLGLVNSYPGVVLPQLAAPLAVVIYKQFFDQVPREYGDADELEHHLGFGDCNFHCRLEQFLLAFYHHQRHDDVDDSRGHHASAISVWGGLCQNDGDRSDGRIPNRDCLPAVSTSRDRRHHGNRRHQISSLSGSSIPLLRKVFHVK